MEKNKNKEVKLKPEKNKEIKKRFNIYTYFIIVLAATLLVVLGFFIRNYRIQRNAQKEYEELAAKVNQLQNRTDNSNQTVTERVTQTDNTESTEVNKPAEAVEDTKAGVNIPEKNLDWDEMRKLNPDIYAWICIPGTDIDYPVLQHPTDDSYYLDYNMNGTRGYPGCIYTEQLNSKEFTDFDTVIYGHNMRNASMFADLHDYEVSTFFENNPYVFIYTGSRVFVYEIFAAYKGDDAHILYMNDFSTKAGRQEYIDSILDNRDDEANIRTDVPVTVDSHLITLSTCVKGENDRRFLVQAVLLNEDDL